MLVNPRLSHITQTSRAFRLSTCRASGGLYGLALVGAEQLPALKPEEQQKRRRHDKHDDHGENENCVESRVRRAGVAHAEAGSRQHDRVLRYPSSPDDTGDSNPCD
jgi:hypothetical protein